jgi:hypothetical protein
MFPPFNRQRKERHVRITHAFAGALAGAAFVATLVVATGSATGNERAAGAQSVQTFTLIEAADTGTFEIVDNDPKSTSGDPQNFQFSGGDSFAFSSELLSKAGRHSGYLHAVCVVTIGGRGFEAAAFHCTGSMNLRGGTLALSALVKPQRPVIISVVGGTGAYEGVTGSITSKERADGNTVDTVRLIRR